MRRISVVTVARSDYGIYLPLLNRLKADGRFELQLLAGGSHLLSGMGDTIEEISAGGFHLAAQVDMEIASDKPLDVARSLGLGVARFSEAFSRLKPEMVVVLGDRFEMFAAAAATVPLSIPLAHIAGGAITQGSFDDVLRHAITKMSHLHFVETPQHLRRVLQMGEEAWRITLTGALALDNLQSFKPMPDKEFRRRFGADLHPPPFVVTYHPATRATPEQENEVVELTEALRALDGPMIITHPNADPGRTEILNSLETLASSRAATTLVANLGPSAYYTLLSRARVMIGNSSSGLVEAPSFRLPVVDVGTRQRGRLAPENVIHSGSSRKEIIQAVQRADGSEHRLRIAGLENPYRQGGAAQKMLEILASVPLDSRPLVKLFQDLP